MKKYRRVAVLLICISAFSSVWATNNGNGHIDVRVRDKLSESRKTATSSTTISSVKHESLDDTDDYDYDDLDLDDDEDYVVHNPKHGTITHLYKNHNSNVQTKDWRTTDCPHELEGRCHCGHQSDPNDKDRLRLVVNCTHAGFKNAEFFKHVPADTEILIVKDNQISDLPANLFGEGRSLELLKELHLPDNGIRTIRGKTFHGVPYVELLILNDNRIDQYSLLDHPRLLSNFYGLKYLHLTRAFDMDPWTLLTGIGSLFKESNLTQLLKIHLEGHKISRIPNSRQFCDLKSIMDIHLGQNELTDIGLDLDECNPSLRFIDLSFNKIRSVTENSGVMEALQHQNQRGEVVQVELYHNPFHCDCQLNFFLQWMHNATLKDPDIIRHRSSLRCETGYPETNKNLILFSVKDTACSLTFITTNEVINRLSWTVVSIIFLSLLIMGVLLYVKVAGMPVIFRSFCSPSLHNPLLSTTTGVKYTSVEKEDVAEVAHV